MSPESPSATDATESPESITSGRDGVAPQSSTPAPSQPSMGRFVLRMGVYVLLGIPLVGFLWQTLNEVLELHFDPIRLFTAIPVLGALFVLLTLLNWSIRDWLADD
jgi:hypothetical protein